MQAPIVVGLGGPRGSRAHEGQDGRDVGTVRPGRRIDEVEVDGNGWKDGRALGAHERWIQIGDDEIVV